LPAGAARWTWELLRAPALALLDTLARVHAAGLVHRDLKPRNVLVTPAGRPVLLDFGLTVGRALADDSVADASALGTPAYAAPEQVRGDPVDARADLYSLGVMLWEALAGRRPHESSRVSGILRSRLAGPVESIARAAPEVPRDVAEVVDALLEVEREARPRSAIDVAERLCGEAADSHGGLPLAGREAGNEPLTPAALRELFAGNDRLLHVHEDAADELWERTAGVPASVAAELEGWRRAGLVEPAGAKLMISRAAVDRLRGGLDVLPAGSATSSSSLSPDLDELLALLHVAWPSTTPALLARLVESASAPLESALEQLRGLGAARQLADGRWRALRISPRLGDAAWRRAAREGAQAELAAALAPGERGRLHHLLACGDDAGASEEALVLARIHLREGRLGDAEAALGEGLRAARRLAGVTGRDFEVALFREWLPVAMGAATPVSADRMLYEVGRSLWRTPHLVPLERLVRAAITASDGDGARALKLATEMPPFADGEAERWRQGLRVRAARQCRLAIEERVVAEACAWAGPAGALASAREWEGRLRYRQERFRDAATALLEAADAASTVTHRLSALLNAASALLELPALDEAEELAARAGELAAHCRLPLFEGRAVWLQRTAAYRRCAPLEPDVELVEATEAVGSGSQSALAAMNEAAVAWRAGRNDVAAQLAARAGRNTLGAGPRAVWLLVRSLECVATGRAPGADEGRRMLEEASTTAPLLVGFQVLSLLSRVGVTSASATAALRARRAGTAVVPPVRREILEPAEWERDLAAI
jgi:hypothetical protein